MKSKLFKFSLIIFNVIYVALGWVIYIIFDITSPNDPKFDINQKVRVIVFPILMIVCFIGEIFILKLIFKKVFSSNFKEFTIYIIFNVFVCLAPILIGLIEKLF
ncbi:hypothetical protein SAMN05216469_10773 [Ruminococcus albus]|uniref:Uncharacterized protein n=1 Tax=Ruminococcus albus TaxID=1264 RepID=A0A1H7KRI9_RUMAL|nr:hypothetical protein SAMN05216469_10773 [Ruminococcus albus]